MANKLAQEQSPYLQQHAHNPVDWFPWGDEAFDIARRDNKPVLVSIGYAACHWCHVMEKESFEDEEVAAFMNEHFICIKVDREEHPDVDHMYMDAVQAISGSGGWPLNVFVTPERAPFYGGTYYPPRPAYSRPSWRQLLQRMNEIWHGQQEEVAAQAEQMLQHLRQASQRTTDTPKVDINGQVCAAIADSLLKQADREKGGFGNVPKFPGTMAINFLLEYYHYSGDKNALEHATNSLDAMIAGGIYDQLGGGFARYATDRDWLVPHFEKMLYDNALLIISLSDAYCITGYELYKEIIDETIGFVERELSNGVGGYYCALDADSEGEEGKYYTWSWDEWTAYSGDDTGIAAKYFGIAQEGNWEGVNILHVSRSLEELTEGSSTSVQEAKHIITNVKKNLFRARQNKVRPQTDDKNLLSWNALMNTALSKAGAALSNDNYIRRASNHAAWMLAEFQPNGKLLHTWKNGTAKIPAKLDDYAYLIEALLQLASVSGDNHLLGTAANFTQQVITDFSREDGFFYYTPAWQQDIPVRKVDIYDGATPSANAVMANNLWACGMCMENHDWVERSGAMLRAMVGTTSRYAYSFGYWATLLQRMARDRKTVVCCGKDAKAAALEIREKYVPHALLLTCEKEISEVPILEKKFFGGNLYIFVCSETACMSPVGSVTDAFRQIQG